MVAVGRLLVGSRAGRAQLGALFRSYCPRPSTFPRRSLLFDPKFTSTRPSCPGVGPRRLQSAVKGGEAGSEAEDALLAAAATLATSGVGPEAVQAFSTSQIPCSLRCTISGVTGEEANMLGDLLMSFGAQSTSFSEDRHPDRPEQEIFADGKWNSSQLWDHCSVTATFDVKVRLLSSACLCNTPPTMAVGSVRTDRFHTCVVSMGCLSG
ncbi:uncharacterized protein LOC142358359, partial [Convolutriloba macropyga]|uniref:uncharacterized protein LOC142358359 n=1 Tax=Convolutriloba macropyga TaxID=536237 RepID=UPI003F51EB56